MSISTWHPTQFYVVAVVVSVILSVLIFGIERRFISALTTAAGAFAVSCVLAAGYIMIHPTDSRWLPAGTKAETPPQLPDIPLLGGVTKQLEGYIAQGLEYRQQYEAFDAASHVAWSFAVTGVKAIVVFVLLWLINKLVKARQTRYLPARLRQLELNQAMIMRSLDMPQD